MSKVGYTYGSEWHVLRYLGYHRDALDRAVEEAIPGSSVLGWLDWDFEQRPAAIDRRPPRSLDREFEGIAFLPAPEQDRLRTPLGDFWPCTGSPPNWDAVGRIEVDGHANWLVVEAKSHLGELNSVCKAKGREVGGGLERIIEAFRATQEALGIARGPDAWLGPFYQFSNRLAFLHFFAGQGVPVRLLTLYFLGDRFPQGRGVFCPETEAEWQPSLAVMEQHVGWQPGNPLSGRIHKLFLPVCPVEKRPSEFGHADS
jgi:hypothetical protein